MFSRAISDTCSIYIQNKLENSAVSVEIIINPNPLFN